MTKYGITPLHDAVERGHAEVVTQLLAKKGINVNQRDKSGRTPFYIAKFREAILKW